MKKKTVAMMLVLAMAASMAACGSGDDASSTSKSDSSKTASSAGSKEEDGAKAEGGDLVWATWSSQEDSTKDVINGMADEYNAKGGSQVEVIGWPWADTQQQLIIRNQGSEVMDVAQVDIGMFGALSEMGILVDMNELMGEDYLKENYSEAALEVGNVEGQQLAVPWSIASINMVYNPTLLKEVGYEEPPKTIEEFEACMKALKEKNPDIIPYGISTKDATMATDFQPWLWTFGASLVDEDGKVTVDSEAATKCTDWYKGLLDNGYIQMNIARSDARTLFAQGKMAFYDDAISSNGVAVSNGLDEATLDQYIQPMDRPVLKEGDTPQASMWGHLLVVFKKSENQTQAADFIKYLVSDEVSLNYLESNGMPPVLKSGIESDAVKNNAWVSKWLDITADGRKLEFALKSNGAELNNIVVEELQAVLTGDKDSKTAVADMQARLESSY